MYFLKDLHQKQLQMQIILVEISLSAILSKVTQGFYCIEKFLATGKEILARAKEKTTTKQHWNKTLLLLSVINLSFIYSSIKFANQRGQKTNARQNRLPLIFEVWLCTALPKKLTLQEKNTSMCHLFNKFFSLFKASSFTIFAWQQWMLVANICHRQKKTNIYILSDSKMTISYMYLITILLITEYTIWYLWHRNSVHIMICR